MKPTGDHVLVKPIANDKEMKLGNLVLAIPDTAQDKPNRGEIVSVGEGRIGMDGKLRTIDLVPGQRILFSKYAGNEFTIGEDLFIVLSYDDILVLLGAAAIIYGIWLFCIPAAFIVAGCALIYVGLIGSKPKVNR